MVLQHWSYSFLLLKGLMTFLFSHKLGYSPLCAALAVDLLSVRCVVILTRLLAQQKTIHFCRAGFLKLQEAEMTCWEARWASKLGQGKRQACMCGHGGREVLPFWWPDGIQLAQAALHLSVAAVARRIPRSLPLFVLSLLHWSSSQESFSSSGVGHFSVGSAQS